MSGVSGKPVVTTAGAAVYPFLPARLRVQWHPVFPTPSVFGAKDFVYDSDASRRETADAYLKLAV